MYAVARRAKQRVFVMGFDGMDPTLAIVMLAATYVGAEYGGSIPAILIRTPGTNAAAATVIDTRAVTGSAGSTS